MKEISSTDGLFPCYSFTMLGKCCLFALLVFAVSCSDSDSDSAPDAGFPDSGACTPGERECVADLARVCVASGDRYNEVNCANGCLMGECAPASLESGWLVHQYDLVTDSIRTPASYTFEDEGLVAIQSTNAMASVYYNDTELPEGIEVRGRFSVRTTTDDDLIGFVFAWQDPQHYYLFDWKQATQNDPCGLADEGASLKLVNSDTVIDDCTDFWRSTGTDRVLPLVTTSDNPQGWVDNVDYDLVLRFRPGDISIEISSDEGIVVSISSPDSTYRSGKFGFFNYSQAGVRYEFFSISPID